MRTISMCTACSVPPRICHSICTVNYACIVCIYNKCAIIAATICYGDMATSEARMQMYSSSTLSRRCTNNYCGNSAPLDFRRLCHVISNACIAVHARPRSGHFVQQMSISGTIQALLLPWKAHGDQAVGSMLQTDRLSQ